ncbi:MAG: universal stress protein [Candidatus Lokiarchaeota archaeon]
MYKKILVGIDGSKHSNKALLKAIEIQKLNNAKVVVFHSVEHHAVPTGMFMGPSQSSIPPIYDISDPNIKRIKEVYEKNGQAFLNNAERIFTEEGIQVETRLVYEDDPVSYIKKVVEKQDFDIVVVGSKGAHSFLEEITLGSVADKVLRHIPCDVLIVK